MNITRNNYEEFFMLYADGELSAADKRLVEAFVAANPDMAEELALFQQFKLDPDETVVYTDKEALLKTEGATLITPANCEAYFVLYADNELSKQERMAVEAFVSMHPQWQPGFDTVQQIKLQPDSSIVFQNKEALLRYEEDDRVVPFRWWRMAAAALLLLTAGALWIYRSGTNAIPPPIVKKQTPVTIEPSTALDSKVDKTGNDASKGQLPVTGAGSPSPVTAVQQSQTVKLAGVEKEAPEKRKSVPYIPEPKHQDEMVKADNVISTEEGRLTGSKPASIRNDAVKPAVINTDIAAAASKSVTNHALTYQESDEKDVVEGSDATAASNDQLEVLTTSVNTKNSLRGFFRKASRLVARKTNATDDDSKRKSILIGGFEIAVR